MLANCFTSMLFVTLLTAALGPSLAVAPPEQPGQQTNRQKTVLNKTTILLILKPHCLSDVLC
jgi:hypothetical protein